MEEPPTKTKLPLASLALPLLAVLLSLTTVAAAQPGVVISTVAGTGIDGFNGDGIPATTAQLSSPFGVVVDGSGNLFIADAGNHRIRRVDGVTGIISTVAGTGGGGFNGDGIPATTAQLRLPRGVVVDGSGNLFIADTDNNRIRRVDGVTGIISTVAGAGILGFNGDGILATTARLNFPPVVVVGGSGNLFIADTNNHRIRKVQIYVIEQDSLALVALYNATNGASWTINSNWLAGPVSTWFGVTVSGGLVSALTLDANQLTGAIPAELGNLTSLTRLSLSSNQLTGSIPAGLGAVSGLRELFLSGNQLTGSIPTELGNLTELLSLHLSSNQLTGTIPMELGAISGLIQLELLLNELTGSIPPELGNLAELNRISLNNNQLTGVIPPELGSLLNLTFLDLGGNQLTGAIPEEIGNLTKLTYLNVNFTQLTGTLPQSLINLSVLDTFFFLGTSLCESLDPAFQAWLQGITNLQSTGCTNVANEERAEVPDSFVLGANYPNPFNPSTKIHYALPHAAAVHLTVYDVRGLLVTTLVDAHQVSGLYDVSFDASRLPSGVYFYRIEAGAFQKVRTMVLLK